MQIVAPTLPASGNLARPRFDGIGKRIGIDHGTFSRRSCHGRKEICHGFPVSPLLDCVWLFDFLRLMSCAVQFKPYLKDSVKHPDAPEIRERVSLPFAGIRARFFYLSRGLLRGEQGTARLTAWFRTGREIPLRTGINPLQLCATPTEAGWTART